MSKLSNTYLARPLRIMLASLMVSAAGAPAIALTIPCVTACPVAQTGVIHPVFIVGNAYFPDRVYAKPGDEIVFHNLASTSHRVRATDNSWSSGTLWEGQSYRLEVQSTTKSTFYKVGKSSVSGRFYIASTPTMVDFGDLIDHDGTVIGKEGIDIRPAEDLGYTLARLGGTLRGVGDGLVDGVTSLLGLGN